MNFAKIDGKRIPYTACTSVPNATEPYKGALNKFPDYKKVAEGTISDISQEWNLVKAMRTAGHSLRTPEERIS